MNKAQKVVGHEFVGFNVVKTMMDANTGAVEIKTLINVIRTSHPLGDDFGSDLPLLFKLHEIC